MAYKNIIFIFSPCHLDRLCSRTDGHTFLDQSHLVHSKEHVEVSGGQDKRGEDGIREDKRG